MLANDSGKNLIEFIQLFKKLSPDLQSYVLQQINDLKEKEFLIDAGYVEKGAKDF